MIKEKIYKVKKFNNFEMFPSDPFGSLDDSLVFIDAGFVSKLSKRFGEGNYINKGGFK